MAETIRLIPDGVTVQLTNAGSGDPVGFGFGVPGDRALGEGAQVQRWLLLTRDRKNWPPHINARMEYPTDDHKEWRADKLDLFLGRVEKTFSRGLHCYAKVNCKRVSGADSLLSTLPDGTDPLGAPPFLEPKPSEGVQADIGTCQIRWDGRVAGYLTTPRKGAASMRRVEYWALFPEYKMPTSEVVGRGRVTTTMGPIESAQEFAMLLSAKSWSESCVLVVASCGYYDTLPEDL